MTRPLAVAAVCLVLLMASPRAQQYSHGGGSSAGIFSSALSYGCIGDGATNNDTCLTAALTALNAAGGGTLYFPCGVYRINSQIVIPNSAGSPSPTQTNIRLTGAGGGPNWYANYTGACARLDLRYASTGAKIETLGRGTLMIDRLTLQDGGSSNSTPFLHTTNTTLGIDGVTFIGTTNVTQDAIVLGGTVAAITSDTTGAFQGYGTVINANTFTKLNRGVYARTWANSVAITNNNWIQNTGTTALESDGTVAPSNGNYGLTVTGNTIEMETYTKGIVLAATRHSLFASNSFWDPAVQVLNNYYLSSTSSGNTFIGGVDSIGQVKTYPDFGGDATSLALSNIIGYANHTFDTTVQGEAANELAGNVVVKGGYDSTKAYPGQLAIVDVFATTSRVAIGYDSTNNKGVITAKTGATSRLLDLNPGGTVRSPSLLIGTGSVSWTVGAGAPSGACTTGSIYSRSDGGASTSHYVCESTAWVAK